MHFAVEKRIARATTTERSRRETRIRLQLFCAWTHFLRSQERKKKPIEFIAENMHSCTGDKENTLFRLTSTERCRFRDILCLLHKIVTFASEPQFCLFISSINVHHHFFIIIFFCNGYQSHSMYTNHTQPAILSKFPPSNLMHIVYSTIERLRRWALWCASHRSNVII